MAATFSMDQVPNAYLFISLSQVYDGSYLSMREVVVITINYRLGVFGFFNGNSTDSTGNQGLGIKLWLWFILNIIQNYAKFVSFSTIVLYNSQYF